ncbi:MAG: CCA tRNA nucleotidyltransferase [Oscillospiraceae bacterium]|jgi:tRNA nucleotidyltransferase (CCA-adding enzyme)|nr:CCA tRNA nucleotidyltransferase [Oscillospiraceae bacterium]
MNQAFILLPDDVSFILSTLSVHGHTAYIVGGCVRDCVMQKTPEDWDICTSAKPQETKEAFSDFRTIDTGLSHGTVTVIVRKKPYEITTYRIDGDYQDNRRPERVTFISDLAKDLSRRDFTVNAMAYNESQGLVDLFGGMRDIENRRIRTVGDAGERFLEDALRILRALRFASTLGFAIDPATARAIHENKSLLQTIAKERIQAEFSKLLVAPGAHTVLREFYDVFFEIIPGLPSDAGLFNQNFHAIACAKHDLEVRLALLLYNIAELNAEKTDFPAERSAEIAKTVLKSLRYENKVVSTVATLILHHDTPIAPTGACVKKWLHTLGETRFKKLLLVRRALSSSPKNENLLEELAQTEQCMQEILNKNDCFSLQTLAIGGNDLLALGLAGKDVGNMLDHLLELVIAEKIPNKEEKLLKTAVEILNRTNKSKK